jgi:hypothetical protein
VFSRPSLEYQGRNHTSAGSKKTYAVTYEKPNGLSLFLSLVRGFFPKLEHFADFLSLSWEAVKEKVNKSSVLMILKSTSSTCI